MMRLLVMHLLLALVVFNPSSSARASADKWTQLFEAGLRAYNIGDFAAARTSWTAALVEAETSGLGAPPHIETLDWLANLEERAGHVGKAEGHLRKKVMLMDGTTGFDRLNLFAARTDLAAFLERHNRRDEAEAILRDNIKLYEALVSGSWTADPHLALARFYDRQGDLVSAANEFRMGLSWIGEGDAELYANTLEEYANLLSRMQREDDSKKARTQARQIRDKYSAEIEENRRRISITDEPSR